MGTQKTALFLWDGSDRSGRHRSGKLYAADARAAQMILYRQGVFVSSLHPARIRLLPWIVPLSAKHRLALFRQLSMMLSGGLPLLKALDVLQRAAVDNRLSQLLGQIGADVRNGASLAESMTRQPRCFDRISCRLLSVGERTGQMAQVLEYICVQMQHKNTLQRRMRQALFYPLIVCLFAVLLGVLLLLWVVPRFATTFADFGAELPALTRWVIALSANFNRSGSSLLFVFVLCCIAVFVLRRLPRAALHSEFLLRCLPWFGSLLSCTALANFCMLVAIALRAGTPLAEALAISARGTGSEILGRDIAVLREQILHGASFADALGENARWPNLLRSMVEAGEQSGHLLETLEFLGAHYAEEQELLRQHLSVLLEPLLILLLGVLLGIFVLAMYLPVFRLGAIL